MNKIDRAGLLLSAGACWLIAGVLLRVIRVTGYCGIHGALGLIGLAAFGAALWAIGCSKIGGKNK